MHDNEVTVDKQIAKKMALNHVLRLDVPFRQRVCVCVCVCVGG